MLEITKTNCESARESGNSVADVVEEMIDEALAIASEYLDFGDAPELLERGRKKINRLENYNYALNNLKQHMMDMEYNMNLDMYAVIRAQGDTELEFDEFNPSMVTHINTGKIDTYIRGKVELDVEAITTRIDELKDLRKSNPENYTKK